MHRKCIENNFEITGGEYNSKVYNLENILYLFLRIYFVSNHVFVIDVQRSRQMFFIKYNRYKSKYLSQLCECYVK